MLDLSLTVVLSKILYPYFGLLVNEFLASYLRLDAKRCMHNQRMVGALHSDMRKGIVKNLFLLMTNFYIYKKKIEISIFVKFGHVPPKNGCGPQEPYFLRFFIFDENVYNMHKNRPSNLFYLFKKTRIWIG